MRSLNPGIPLTRTGNSGKRCLGHEPEYQVLGSATSAQTSNSVNTAKQGNVLGMRHFLTNHTQNVKGGDFISPSL